jgi:SAM-dependent methyltransferase
MLHVNPDSVRNTWTNRTGEYSPAYYAHHGPNETSALIRDILSGYLHRDAAVLELGCGSGRHLEHLANDGFENLSGIDINAEAFETMRETYPTLAADGTFHCGPIEELIEDFDDGQFDAVYSVETLQHLHPDVEWVFEEIARITDTILVTAEIEGPTRESASPDSDVNYVDEDTPLYYRDWGRIFTALDLVEVDVVRGDRDTTRTFRASG